ncbi:MAG: CBS domain-containing protein [Hyphomicrobiales bacterium]|nr:CBS domain-containing protein [Hyphomicrobiales bacterium]
MMVKQIMNTQVASIDPTNSIAAAAKMMRDEDIGCLLVGDDDRLLGVVTDRDIVVRALANGRNANFEPISTVMSYKVLCCFEDQPVEKAAIIMANNGVRRLPVLDREGRLTGIVSLSDLHGGASRQKPWEVTFYKEITDSRGIAHEAPLTTVYVAEADGEDEAAVAARKIFDEDWCPSRWKAAADGCRVAGGTGARTSRSRPEPMLARRGVAAARTSALTSNAEPTSWCCDAVAAGRAFECECRV